MMSSLLLSVLSQLLVMGLPTLDPVMNDVLTFIHTHALFLNSFMVGAKGLGLCLATCMVGYECWNMILGRRGIDVLRLLRIVGLAICISSAGTIGAIISAPGDAMGTAMKAQAKASHQQVDQLEKKVANLQNQYYEKLRNYNDTIKKAQMTAEGLEESSTWDQIKYAIGHLSEEVDRWSKQIALISETWLSEKVNMIVRYIGEIIYQVAYYGMLLGQSFMMNVLLIFAPLAFALSIVPPWGSAWSQWISKYVSLSLWAPLIYMASIYGDMILKFTILEDIQSYTTLLGKADVDFSWSQIGTIGLQGIGTTCFYVVGLLVGVMLLKFVPELASWIIPGGASSSIGQAATGMATAGASAIGGAIGGAAGSALSLVSVPVASAAGTAMAGANAVRHGVGGAVSGAVQGGVGGARGGLSGGGTMGSVVSGTVSGAVNGARERGLNGLSKGWSNSRHTKNKS